MRKQANLVGIIIVAGFYIKLFSFNIRRWFEMCVKACLSVRTSRSQEFIELEQGNFVTTLIGIARLV